MNTAHGLVIGIEQYNEFERVPFARDDAQAIWNHLWQAKHYPIKRERCTLLTDADATNTNVRRALRELFERRCAPGDTVFVYFAGHGVFDTTGGYLIPSDLKRDADLSQGISFDLLDKFVEKAQPGTFILLVDSCHSGELARLPGSRSARDIELAHVSQAEGISAEGRVILSSCTTSQKAYSDDELAHGVFTYYLLEALQGGTQQHPVSCPVSAYKMVDHVKQRVVQHGRMKQSGPIQAPQDFIKTSEMVWLPSSPGPGGVSAPDLSQAADGGVVELDVGALRITSKPGGARVILDGEDIGMTPLTLSSVPAGEHHLWTELAGFEPSERRITIGPRRVETLHEELQPARVQRPVALPKSPHAHSRRSRRMSRKAMIASLLGILSVFTSVLCCGIVLGPISIGFAIGALHDIRAGNGRVTGIGAAWTGLILGVLSIILFLIFLQIGLSIDPQWLFY